MMGKYDSTYGAAHLGVCIACVCVSLLIARTTESQLIRLLEQTLRDNESADIPVL